MKQGVWWVQSLMEVWAAVFYTTQEWHACPCSTPEAIAVGYLAFELSKLKFRAYYWFDELG